MKIDFGYSPCPNDTFMFWAWAKGRLGDDFVLRPDMADIQELNQRALSDSYLDFTKVSAATYCEPEVQERYRLLSSGAALGRGCGPLVVSSQEWSLEQPTPLRLAFPGRNTTAFRLAEMAIGDWVSEWVELRYDQIMPAVLKGEVDAGVIIHESRFAYQALGLKCALDLGGWWESKTGLPLPLGVMVARRDLAEQTVQEVESLLRESIAQAWTVIEQPKESEQGASLWSYLRDNAIEIDDDIMRSHIDLYVNNYSSDLGSEGREAIETFARLVSAVVR